MEDESSSAQVRGACHSPFCDEARSPCWLNTDATRVMHNFGLARNMPKSSLAPGLYSVDDDGAPQQLAVGSYSVDEEGAVGPAVDWQIPLTKLPWEKAPELLEMWSKRSGAERVVNLVGMYLLVGVIIGIAGVLAWHGIVEGQALVGFLGAALGYLLARGRIPGRSS